jgi:probable phosphoglycerate mutase
MLWLIRHGETAWSLSGAHTGRTDVPLTETGVTKAAKIREKLAGLHFSLVLVSPLERARKTCEIAGFAAHAQIDPDLLEWNYGDYEGLTTDQIRAGDPGWSIFSGDIPNGESIDQVAERARRVIARALEADGDVALFAHGHILRILAACWVGLPPVGAKLLALSTASVSTLGYEHETRVITRWNS